ncbi:MAG: hypothetical protein IKO25_11680 [Clostridia bacterium]|nr:hypothetical protein [Clostridia bacterium]
MKQSTKEAILNTPVIGQIAALVRLPREIRNLRSLQAKTAELQGKAGELQEKLQAETEKHQRETEDLRQAAEENRQAAEERWQATTQTFDSLGQDIRNAQEQIRSRNAAADERWQAATQTFDSLGQGIRDLQEQLAAAREELRFSRGFRQLLENGAELSELRSRMSVQPAVWGPADRLHIDPEASVDACLFNTNSGSITIGRHSFAGPGVSLIAGNHDMRLTGFPRRDLQQETGCDIVIGEGVWLCANCTVLGPCRIGDNAVIAAGAVVIPGTEAEAGCLYAGVPARKIREIDGLFTGEEASDEAFDRFGGCIYTRGWYMAETIRDGEQDRTGHWMIAEEAEILCRAGERTLHYVSPLGTQENRSLRLSLGDWQAEITPGASGEIRIPAEAFGARETGRLRLTVSGLFAPQNGDTRKLGLFIG